MAVRTEKTEQGYDIVVDGFEQGIAVSPHKGTANIQNANISTEMGEVMNSFARTQQSMTDTTATGSLAFVDTSHVSLSIPSTNNLFKGNWIAVTGSSNTSQLPNGTYFVPPSTGSNFELANYYNAANFTPATANVSALVLGGAGGAGVGSSGSGAGGGGGAGGLQTGTIAAAINAYTITVGTVGANGTSPGTAASIGVNGTSSTFSTLTATGGGGGGGSTSSGGIDNGLSGASGGGGGGIVNSASGTGGAATQGFAGGNGQGGLNPNNGGGGGGGAGAVGSVGTAGTGGAGGTGVSNSITGSPVTYGAGGTGGNGGGSGSVGNPGTSGAGIVIISYPTGTLTATGGSITTSGGNTIHTFTTSGTWTVTAIAAVTVPPILTGFTTGLTASFTMVATMGKALTQATETYYASGISYHRYYILDNQNLVWVYDDQNEILFSSTDNVSWFLPDFHTDWCTAASGLAVISGFLIGACEHGLFGKSVATLGQTNATTTTWVQFPDITGWQGSKRSTTTTHFCLTTHTQQLYITDNSYILSIFPDSVLADPGNNTSQNVQSFDSWTTSDSTHGIYNIISGTSPVSADEATGKRVPVVFFTPNTGVLPATITAGTVYYIVSDVTGSFQVFAASSGGSALDISTGASGVQYFNTFYPIATASASNGATPTYTLTSPAVALPVFEVAQTLGEINTTILIGCKGNIVYPWNQEATQATGLIPLPEGNVVNILTVNQMGYIFAGNKGNIYITDGSTASTVTTIPDYCAGVPGTPSSYIEPVFTWGGAAYVRGRVYFSILDQTSTKAGNCGGVWSFVPTQNFYIGQDVGISMRLENQSSYGTYNGVSPIIITKQTQNVIAPQYWNAWWSDITGITYGIDFTGTGTASALTAVIETELISTGSFLSKKTFKQIEYKLASPLPSGSAISIAYRQNLTDAWASCGTIQSDNLLSGDYPVNFEKGQWLQLQATLTTTTATPGTFVRLAELRIR